MAAARNGGYRLPCRVLRQLLANLHGSRPFMVCAADGSGSEGLTASYTTRARLGIAFTGVRPGPT